MQINEVANRFELSKNEHIAYADFEKSGEELVIHYVFAPPELRGTGTADELMQAIKEYAEKENLTIVPICSYAASWLKRNG